MKEQRDVAREKKVLLGDIGGTNVRFAVMTGGDIGPVEHLTVSNYRSLGGAIGDYLEHHGDGAPPDVALVGVAGAIERGRGTLVNSQWQIDAGAIHAQYGIKSVHLLNDFEALAYALPHLTGHDVKAIAAGGKPPPGEAMAVLGPGTGLGMAGIVHRGEHITVVPTEGGHATLPGTTAREDAVIAWLRERYGHASAERALSGPGLENLHAAIAALDGVAVPERPAADITRLGLDGSCPVCVAALDMFCAMLGTVAGDLALMFRARGGIYIAGGIGPHIVDKLAQSDFLARFKDKGRFRPWLERIPVTVIVNPDSAFLGLKALAARMSDPAFRDAG